MTSSTRMDKNIIETILDLTLEIISLLTGETYTAVKSGDLAAIMGPSHHFVIPDKTNEQKLLAITKKMFQLLMGEIGEPSRLNITVKEEIEEDDDRVAELDSSEGYKELYKAVMTEEHPPLTSRDGSRKRHPSERSSRPQYSRDSTLEDQEILHHDQSEKDPTGSDVKYKKKEEEGRLQSTVELGLKVKDEDHSRGLNIKRTSEEHLTLPSACKLEADYITRGSLAEQVVSSSTPARSIRVQRSLDPSNPEETSISTSQKRVRRKEKFCCSVCGKCFARKSYFQNHQKLHTGEPLISCPECGKCFMQKSDLHNHLRLHTGERPFACSECRKCFTQNSDLQNHVRLHTGERPFLCSECGRRFAKKANLRMHFKLHTGERPYSCPECEKSYIHKISLQNHLRVHTGERPFSCPQCGRCFSVKSELARHIRRHTSQLPSSCPK